MASLRYIVSQFKDELRDGIAWVAFWKEGRSWNGEYFYLDSEERLSMKDKTRLEEICSMDAGAVIVNGYYGSYFREDMSISEMVFGVRCHYENRYDDIPSFMKSHEPGAFEAMLEKAREAAHSVGMPFAGVYDPDEDFDPYVYDGRMSLEDVELMHRLMEEGG